MPPIYEDPDLQQIAINGFELGVGMGYDDARHQLELNALAATTALSLAPGAAARIQRAVQRLSKFPIPIIGVGAGGMGFGAVPKGPFKLPGEAALRKSADQIQAVGGKPPSAQTVFILASETGETMAAAGGIDLTDAQKALARKHGHLIAKDFPTAHGEITALSSAGPKNLVPLGGVATNIVCHKGPGNCLEQISRMAARGGYGVQLSPDGRAFRFVKLKTK